MNKAVILSLVDELLARKEVNIWWLPDNIERMLYFNVISLMLSVLDEIVEGMSMNFAGVSARVRPAAAAAQPSCGPACRWSPKLKCTCDCSRTAVLRRLQGNAAEPALGQQQTGKAMPINHVVATCSACMHTHRSFLRIPLLARAAQREAGAHLSRPGRGRASPGRWQRQQRRQQPDSAACHLKRLATPPLISVLGHVLTDSFDTH